MDIEVLRRKIVSDQFELTQHAKDEAAEDDFDLGDIEQIVLTGKIVRVLSRDKRGVRYVVAGLSREKKEGEVVCRILPSGTMRIITVYSK